MQGSLLDGLAYIEAAWPERWADAGRPLEGMPRRVVEQTLYHECRGEPVQGQIAVACVIRNRVQLSEQRPRWWGVGWLGVCLQPWQFSCWNQYTTVDNPAAMLPQFLDGLYAAGQDYVGSLLWAANGVQDGHQADVTDGATHYHTTAVSPAWMTELTECCKIGAHVFYR